MNCSSCGFANPPGMNFCGKCAAQLTGACSACGFESPPEFAFCGKCGASLSGDAMPRGAETATPVPERAPSEYTPRHLADKILSSKSALEGERKHITVLFADVKGSMDLSERVDPEHWHRILDRFFSILADGVHRFEGTINQYTGDGIMALFGAPIGHEDHAQRACYAALALRDDLRAYSDELRLADGLDFAVRVGINSGEVVVGKIGDDLRMDYTAQGHTVGLAARMESLAPAHGICLSQATADLVSGYVSLRDLGTSTIKGVSDPVTVYELEGMGELQTRFDVSRARGLTRFVGRDDDMAVLERALEQTRAGNGQVIGVVAQAGTGKSRLCFEFAERCRAKGLSVLHASGVAHGKNVPFLPILQLFRQYFGITERDGERMAREKIAGRLLLMGEEYREALPLMFDFMSVPDGAQPVPDMSPEARQRQLFGILRRVVETGGGASINLIEDLHWIDEGSEAWIEQMVEAVTGSESLLIVNFRPEYHASWMQKSWYRQLPLLPLGADAIRELLDDLLGTHASIAGLAEAVHERTGGNPFFTEEIVQTLIESGSLVGTRGQYELVTAVEHLEVPGTVQSVLAARIDRLGEREKQVLQSAAVIGKEFSEPVLALVVGLREDELAEALRALKGAEFIYEQSLYPVTEYAFKHPLTQEVAVGSQLSDRKKRTHSAVARAITEVNSGRLDKDSALLAHHYEAAGELLEAVQWNRRAAEWLLPTDPSEARRHWLRVRDLAQELPASDQVARHELWACDLLLSNSWRVGVDGDELESLAARGRALATQLGDAGAASGIESGLSLGRTVRGDLEQALAPGRRGIELAVGAGRERLLEAKSTYQDALWHGGMLEESLRIAEEVIEQAAGDHDLGKERYGVPLTNWALGRRGILLQLLGRPVEAADSLERSLQIARERDEREVTSWLLTYLGAWQEAFLGLDCQSLSRAMQARELADRVGSPLSLVMAVQAHAWALLLAGQPAAALEPLNECHALEQRGVFRSQLCVTEALLAQAHLEAGNVGYAREFAQRCDAEYGARAWEIFARLARARVLRTLDGPAARSEIESTLGRADSLVAQSGARAFIGMIREERARLAGALGDEEGLAAGLSAAHDLYTEIGATGHAARLTIELG